MAAVAPPADQAADLLQKLSLDSQAKTIEIPDATKKPSVDSANIANRMQLDRSITPLIPDFMDPSVCYLPNGYPSAYYYGGFEGKEWEDYSRYMNPEGVELTPGAYGDNGSLMYHQYGYTPYGPYSPAASPIPTLGHEGQLYGPQHYQYPTAYFQSMPPTSGSYPSLAATGKGETVAPDQVPLPKSNGTATKGNNGTVMPRSTYQNSSLNANGSYGRGHCGVPANGYQDPRFAFDGLHSPIPWIETPYIPDAQPRAITSSSMTSTIGNGNGVPSSKNQNYRPHTMGLNNTRLMPTMNTADGYMNQMYANKLYGQYGNTYRSSVYGSNGYDVRAGGRGWVAVDGKYKPRGRGNGFYSYGNESMDGLNELNRGPRTQSTKNLKDFTQVALAVKGQSNIPSAEKADNEKSIVIPDREQYNKPDFPETCPYANFFIIKSYSEDDVHKSIKYNIWASTPNGNKKLDAVYQSAQQKPGGCPVFLFFSVNTSGQFVGVAEMIGPVDFDKNVDYWQQDKWIGCFPVKWHIVKDVPNSLLKHITLENNENKPVTNSRDTQEVKLEEGLQVLKIFKDHISKQCILDDFDFYEDRQKKILEKKTKQQYFHKPTQVWEGKPIEDKNQDSKENGNNDSKSRNEVENETAAAVVANGYPLVMENNGETPKTAAIPEQKIVANSVANGC